MKWHRVSAICSIMASSLFWPWAGITVAQESAHAAIPIPAKASQQEATRTSQTLRLTLQDALALARKNSTQFQAAQTDAALARQDRFQAAAALLPSVNYNNQALYTQLNRNGVIFIANNAAHEYISQANVHEALDLAGFSSFRRASFAAVAARARAEIASRGLVVTVVQSYYAVAAAQQNLEAAQRQPVQATAS